MKILQINSFKKVFINNASLSKLGKHKTETKIWVEIMRKLFINSITKKFKITVFDVV